MEDDDGFGSPVPSDDDLDVDSSDNESKDDDSTTEFLNRELERDRKSNDNLMRNAAAHAENHLPNNALNAIVLASRETELQEDSLEYDENSDNFDELVEEGLDTKVRARLGNLKFNAHVMNSYGDTCIQDATDSEFVYNNIINPGVKLHENNFTAGTCAGKGFSKCDVRWSYYLQICNRDQDATDTQDESSAVDVMDSDDETALDPDGDLFLQIRAQSKQLLNKGFPQLKFNAAFVENKNTCSQVTSDTQRAIDNVIKADVGFKKGTCADFYYNTNCQMNWQYHTANCVA